MRHWLPALTLAASAWAQPAQVQILADQSRLIAGETIQLTAVVRDSSGSVLRDTAIQWSTNPSPSPVATITPQGQLTGNTLGIVIVRAQTAGGARVETPFQILPSRVAISPEQANVAIGAAQQFTVTAFDKDNRPIPNTAFTWAAHSIGYDFTPTHPYFDLSTQGNTATVRGRFEGAAHLRAFFTYSIPGAGVPLNMTSILTAQVTVQVTGPRDYTVRIPYSSRRAATTDLRYRPSILWTAPDGSLYFNASLGSVSNGLLRWKNGVIEPVLLGGRASTTPGAKVVDFGLHSFSGTGDVLAFELTTDGNRVLRGDTSGGAFRPVLVSNTPGAGVDYIGGYSLSKHSLNKFGQYVFRAGFRDPNTRQFITGLFRGSVFGLEEVLVSTLDQLPDLPAGSFDIDWASFGINDEIVSHYRLNVPGKSVIYRHDERGRTKLIATGDRFQNSTILDFIGPPDGAPAQPIYFAANGETLVGVRLQDSRNYLLRLPVAPGGAPETLALSWPGAAVLDHHPTHGSLVFVPLDNQLKVAIWKRGEAPRTLLTVGETQLAGTRVESVFSGAFGPNGEIYLSVRGANARQIVAQVEPQARVLFQTGERLNFAAEPVIYSFTGARTGPVQVLTGGAGASSISELQGGNLVPRLTVGDTIGRNSLFPGTQAFAYSRTASGQIYTLVPWVGANRDFGIARLRADGSPELLHPFNLTIDGLEYFMPWRLQANDRGDLLWQTGTARGDSRLVLTRNGQHRSLLTNSADPTARSVIDGLTVVGIDNSAVDESGRVLAVVRFRERLGSALVGWDGQNWTRLVTTGETEIDRRRVAGLGILRAAGPHLMAHIYYDAGLAAPVAWRNGRIENVVSPAELTPLGYNVSWISTFDVNTRGDVAYVSGYPDGGQGVFVKRGDRTFVVLNAARPVETELLMGLNQIELRDNGTVYLLAPNSKSETLVIEATPRF